MGYKRPEYLYYKDVPPDMTYPSAWRQRGYRVREGEIPLAFLRELYAEKDEPKPLYSIVQCAKMKGEKAKQRRRIYLAALMGED